MSFNCPILPERIPRQKVYLYAFLIFFTTLLLYFYSYPLNLDNWVVIRDAKDSFDSFYGKKNDAIPTNASGSTISIFIQNLFPDSNERAISSRLENGNSGEAAIYSTASVSNLIHFEETSSKTYESTVKNKKTSIKLSTEFELKGRNMKLSSIGSRTTSRIAMKSKFESNPASNGARATTLSVTQSGSQDKTTSNEAKTNRNEIQSKLGGRTASERSTTHSTMQSKSIGRTTSGKSGTTTRRVTHSKSEDKISSHEAKANRSETQTKMENRTTPVKLNTTNRIVAQSKLEKTASEASGASYSETQSKLIEKTQSHKSRTPYNVSLAKNETSTTEYDFTEDAYTQTAVTTKSKISDDLNATVTGKEVEKGFLVFSENCRIPDVDPMHSSIRHLIAKSPPLDCSKDYKNLTWTEGNVLHLDREATYERAKGNYTCCYKSIYRRNDGESDNNVGYGEECIKINNITTIKDEFITVECNYQNATQFYKEFHSFIHDKPEVEERCNKSTESKYSILIIGADATSRINMHRQFNATARYLLEEMGAIEMYGFNKVGDNTFPNLIPLLVGYDERELPQICWKYTNMSLDKCNFIWKSYAEKGYRTFYAEDTPHISSFNYVKKGFFHQPTDYYFRHFILAYEDALGRHKHLNCHQCIGSTSETEAVLHWAQEFASHFSDRPYFAFSWINSLTHDFLNMGSSGDHMYEHFFRSLHKTGALNRTIVVLMGDHGMRWGDIRKTFIGRLEERLPMLLIVIPEQFKQEHPTYTKILRQNSHRLITPFDLHATLQHLLNLNNYWKLKYEEIDHEWSKNFTKRALSLFRPIPEDRSCDDAFIEEHWCTCETSLEADINSKIIKNVGNFLVNYINNLLEPISNKCAHLKLISISDARLWQPPSEHEGHSVEDNIYTVVVHTEPGKAVFEGTVKISPRKQEELLGTISRLNLYGNQSACVDDAVRKKYCFCL